MVKQIRTFIIAATANDPLGGISNFFSQLIVSFGCKCITYRMHMRRTLTLHLLQIPRKNPFYTAHQAEQLKSYSSLCVAGRATSTAIAFSSQ
jgi:hypothetical protein